MAGFQLAQINIARARAPLDSDTMKGFVDRLEEVNALADSSPGFIWRLQTEEGDATSILAFDDPKLILNMSVWQDLESLKHYVYKSAHVDLVRDREGWFSKLSRAYQALWWIPAGHIPSVEEGKAKLDHVRNHGPGEQAFTFARNFPSPEP